MKNYLLIIGGLPDPLKKLGYGGATVLMENFIEFLSLNNISYKFIKTNKFYYKGKPCRIKNLLYLIFHFLYYFPFSKTIMFNFSDHATVFLYPHLVNFSKLFRKKSVFRKFGGSLDVYLQSIKIKKQRHTFNAINKSDLIFLETKAGIEYVKNHITNKSNIHWFPNVRHSTSFRTSPTYKKRFVFISQIKKEKGIDDILNVAKRLSKEYTIDIFGPIMEDKYQNINWESYNTHYGGILTSNEILSKLKEYNILLLTTRYREGYPGIIIEAMSIGMPVITTAVGGIPEIIKDQYNGIFVEQGNIDQIENRIRSINEKSYNTMRINSLKHFQDFFSSDKVNTEILNLIHSI